ncbi:hypothetical protein KIW84_062128 [Lathyrus oleraceus]|uniref:CG-1 domain-containing protein n=1 Tax=Pisum sativum TaxID=3888 RepID=A0A9D5A7W6_PEA|nr:hypothetical protein KIW84_062128 [Pisum sativum]
MAPGYEYDINDLYQEAQRRWLKPAEVIRVLRFFRKDGHAWRKKDGRAVGEAHERLKVGNVEAINCYYAHGEQNSNFQRRSMRSVLQKCLLLDETLPRPNATTKVPVSMEEWKELCTTEFSLTKWSCNDTMHTLAKQHDHRTCIKTTVNSQVAVKTNHPPSQIVFALKYTTQATVFIVLSCLISISVNFSTFLVNGKTSPVTYQVLGHLKTCLVLALGYTLLHDPFSWRNIMGILLAMVGMILYSYYCTLENQQKAVEVATLASQAREGESDPLINLEKGSSAVTDSVGHMSPVWSKDKD